MDTENEYNFIVSEEKAGTRLDVFLTAGGLSRSRAKALLTEGQVTLAQKSGVGQIVSDASRKVRVGEHYQIIVPQLREASMEAQDIPLNIVFEDEHMLVINKAAGMTVHPAAGSPDGTLVNALLAHCGGSLSGIGGVARPGIVHRLDKDTSGLMVVAKHDAAHHALAAQLADRSLKRVYNAFCWGVPALDSGSVDGAIGRSPKNRKKMAILKQGGREALTYYKVLDKYHENFAAKIECRLQTGRTHQIRVHLTFLGHALIGDQLYGGGSRLVGKTAAGLQAPVRDLLRDFSRQALHAVQIAFIHPASGERMEFACELPDDLLALQSALEI